MFIPSALLAFFFWLQIICFITLLSSSSWTRFSLVLRRFFISMFLYPQNCFNTSLKALYYAFVKELCTWCPIMHVFLFFLKKPIKRINLHLHIKIKHIFLGCLLLSFLTFFSTYFEMFFLRSFPLLTLVYRRDFDLSESFFSLSAADLLLMNVDEGEGKNMVTKGHLLRRVLVFLSYWQISCFEEGR